MKSFVPIFTFQVVGGREPSCINWMQESESHPPFFVPPNLSDFNWDLDTDCFAAILRYLDPSRYFLLHLPGGVYLQWIYNAQPASFPFDGQSHSIFDRASTFPAHHNYLD